MNAASIRRTLVNALLPCSLIAMAVPAQADFIYARLVPGAGLEANGSSTLVDVSADGRTVVFASTANNWVGDTYIGTRAVAVDLDTGVIEAVSALGGAVFRGESPVTSGDGRYVAFLTINASYGPNWQVLRKDRQTGELQLASANAAGQPAEFGSEDNTVSISADGRYVAFQTTSVMTDAPGRAGGVRAPAGAFGGIYVKDMTTGQIEMASIKSDGSVADHCALDLHALSGTGRYVSMLCSDASVPGATGGQAYVRDLQANTTELISRSTSATSGSSAFVYHPSISPSGRFVSFKNRGYGGLGYANGVGSEGNSGIYLRDRQAGTTIAIPRAAVLPSDAYDSCSASAVSDIGSVVLSCNYAWGGTGSYPQTFLFVPGAGAPEMLSVTAASQPGNDASGYTLAVNASGLSMAWESNASNIDPADGNNASDIFVLVEESVLSDVIFANGFESSAGKSGIGRGVLAPVLRVSN
ncbi:MAG: hypothetical protein ABIR62_17905 [Dokdonella sp.]|uniref:TolB family protein n=1 Tax=Dokdonella sp. TaxID=2291710 RepID=UPI003264352D